MRGKENEKVMSDEIVRCPYCVLGSEFRPMFRQSKDWFVCASCGHMATLSNPHLKCSCDRCHKMIRIANRCRTSGEIRIDPATDLPAGA
jgi:hypothetical protein